MSSTSIPTPRRSLRPIAPPDRGRHRIALVHLVNWWQDQTVSEDVFAPIGTSYLAASLRRAGYEVSTQTYRFDPDSYRPPEVVGGAPPLFVGISATGNELDALEDLSRRLASELDGVPIVAGGYCSLAGDEVFAASGVDVMAHGEGEDTVVELADALATGAGLAGVAGITYRDGDGHLLRTAPRAQRSDLDELALPSYRHLPPSKGAIRVYASRGCPYECTYCEIKDFYSSKRIRRHGAAWVASLVDRLVAEAEAPVEVLYFNDDEFLLHAEHLTEMAGVARRAGLTIVFQTRARDIVRHRDTLAAHRDVIREVHTGIESFAQGQLDRWRKRVDAATNLEALAVLAELDIPALPYLILTDADTTPDEISETCAGLVDAPAGPVPVLVGDQLRYPRLRPVWRNIHLNRMKTFRGDLERRPESAWIEELWDFLALTDESAGRLALVAARDLASDRDDDRVGGPGHLHPAAELLDARMGTVADLAHRLTRLDREARMDLASREASRFDADARALIAARVLVGARPGGGIDR